MQWRILNSESGYHGRTNHTPFYGKINSLVTVHQHTWIFFIYKLLYYIAFTTRELDILRRGTSQPSHALTLPTGGGQCTIIAISKLHLELCDLFKHGRFFFDKCLSFLRLEAKGPSCFKIRRETILKLGVSGLAWSLWLPRDSTQAVKSLNQYDHTGLRDAVR